MKDILRNKIVLVTGASKGLGGGIARQFAKEKCKVVINYFSNKIGADKIVSEINNKFGNAVSIKCDISKEDDVKEMFREINDYYGDVDILINNARTDPYKKPKGSSNSEWWDKIIGVGLKGAFFCSDFAFKGMVKKRWGRIINISSAHAFLSSPLFLVPYSVSKIGLNSITNCYAMEGAKYGITVNTIAPGLIITESISNRLNTKEVKNIISKIPIGRGASIQEIVELVIFVSKSGFITGETININGGVNLVKLR